MFTDGLFSLLTGAPGVAALLSNRVYPASAPDEVPLPYLVYTQVHRDTIMSYQGVNRLQEVRFQLACYGGDYRSTKLLAAAVKAVLDGFQGELSDGSYVGNTLPNSEHDEIEEVFKDTLFGTILDYSFWWADNS